MDWPGWHTTIFGLLYHVAIFCPKFSTSKPEHNPMFASSAHLKYDLGGMAQVSGTTGRCSFLRQVCDARNASHRHFTAIYDDLAFRLAKSH